ncbi:hypothetical protein ACFYYP_22475 [Microbispora rosea]
MLALLARGLRQGELAADSEPDLLIGHARRWTTPWPPGRPVR